MRILALITFENSIIFAYALVGILSLVAYLPQILTLYKSNGASRDVSIKTWSAWCVEAVVALLYAIFILKDLIASLIFGVDVMGALLILGLTARNRIRIDGLNIQDIRLARLFTWRKK